MVAAPDGYVAAGWTESSGAGKRDGWFVRTDAVGKAVWTKTYGGADVDELQTVVADPSGGFVAAGGTTTDGTRHAWVVRVNSAGEQQWQRTFKSATALVLHDAAALPAPGNGGVKGFEVGLVGQRGTGTAADAWLMRLDLDGYVLEDRNLGTQGEDTLRSIVTTADGGLLLGGSGTCSNGNVSFRVLHTDRWANVPCTAKGCAQKAGADCSDSDPCTLDRCDGKTGTCEHAALPATIACKP